MAETKSLTLVELLNETQPLNELNRLQDKELSELNESEDDDEILLRMQGSLIGLAVGDALGASVEFRPRSYMVEHPVSDMQGGGTWGLKAGQWTDDTSMALCLGASLIAKGGFNGYDQLVRYRWWYRNGYMSSTGKCFDIGASTSQAINEFEKRCQKAREKLQARLKPTVPKENIEGFLELKVKVDCGEPDAAGNGPLMRLAPVPLFYHHSEKDAIQNAGSSAKFTHGDPKAVDACRFYSALIWNAIHGATKTALLDSNFYRKYFEQEPLHEDVLSIAQGSYKTKNGYEDGIRGKGYIINALEAALWAFYNDNNSFEVGVLLAINLGDDTDTTAAIYGQLAGAVYGLEGIPKRWRDQLFQQDFIITLANGLFLKGKNVNPQKRKANVLEAMDEDEVPNEKDSSSFRYKKPEPSPAEDSD